MEGNKEGILGKLLDPIPGLDTLEVILENSSTSRLERLLRDRKEQFIGSEAYIEEMKKKFCKRKWKRSVV
jgi:hypothetical protein